MQKRLIEIAQINQQRAHEIIQELNLIPLWASINAVSYTHLTLPTILRV